MKVPVFRSLDRTNSFLGIKGTYQSYFLIGVGICFLLGFLGGVLIGITMLGFLFGLILSGLYYMYLIHFQSLHDEKERDMMIASVKTPEIIRVHPIPIHSLLTIFKIKSR